MPTFTILYLSKYRHLVFLLLLRQSRKYRFHISNFKHSTGVFELALHQLCLRLSTQTLFA
ncbi:hypothetical protein F6P71_06955 [Streptococcus suis]|nr:hypothetical protein [Streptococcus suis]MBS8079743.1 hypothetical protein [Streptococcus suis]MBS8090213.1 hypothetical protein [Streptococcus suis]